MSDDLRTSSFKRITRPPTEKVKIFVTDLRCERECGRFLEEYTVPPIPGINFEARTFTRPCPCISEREEANNAQRAAELSERKKRQVEEQRSRRFLQTFGVRRTKTLESLEKHQGIYEAYEAITRFLAQAAITPDALGMQGFGLWGQSSIGKTHLAEGLMEKLLQIGMNAISITPLMLAHVMSCSYDDPTAIKASAIVADMMDIPVLILDDLGKERVRSVGGKAVEFMHSQLFTIVNRRLEVGRPVIVTSNYDWVELLNDRYANSEYGVALVDRLIENFGHDPKRWIKVYSTKNYRTNLPMTTKD